MIVPCNWTAQNLRKPKWDGKIITNEQFFFEKLIDSNLLFIAVGRPQPWSMFWQKHFEIKVSFDS